MFRWIATTVLGPLLVYGVLEAAKKIHKPPYWFKTQSEWLEAITAWRLRKVYAENPVKKRFSQAMAYLLNTFCFKWEA